MSENLVPWTLTRNHNKHWITRSGSNTTHRTVWNLRRDCLHLAHGLHCCKLTLLQTSQSATDPWPKTNERSLASEWSNNASSHVGTWRGPGPALFDRSVPTDHRLSKVFLNSPPPNANCQVHARRNGQQWQKNIGCTRGRTAQPTAARPTDHRSKRGCQIERPRLFARLFGPARGAQSSCLARCRFP